MFDIYALLDQYGIAYERHDHQAVFTCEEAEHLVPPLPGAHTKNLFLRDKKGRRFFLVVVGYDKAVDLKALAKVLGVQGLGFASEDKLNEYLGVTPGAATLLGLACDADHNVSVIVDEALWQADAIQCHPLVNTATLVLSHAAMTSFLEATGHTPRVMQVPTRSVS